MNDESIDTPKAEGNISDRAANFQQASPEIQEAAKRGFYGANGQQQLECTCSSGHCEFNSEKVQVRETDQP